ncbi:MAG: fatty acid desaturase [Actinobacteria bacterium]|nr:fatty acid desaturase [Actinomycetota bacterium]
MPVTDSSTTGVLHEAGEWKTLGVIVAVYGLTVLTVVRYDVLTPWLAIPMLAVLGAWHLSMQHELLHGHPFRNQFINDAIGSIPVTLWNPYLAFKKDHHEHHKSDLTNPELDNESYYVSQQQWDNAGPIRRAAWTANRTILFRMFVWTIVSTISYVTLVLKRAARNEQGDRLAVVLHVIGVVAVVYLVSLSSMPLWQFALGTVYGGRILNAIRPFPEHKYQNGVETKTAMIMAGPFMSLLMLNNNLHIAHHDDPKIPWYRVNELSKRVNAVERAREAGVLYEGGYAEVFRKFSFTPVDSPVRERN